MKRDKYTEKLVQVTVNDLSWMTPRGRHEIALWLRRQAELIDSNYGKLAPKYTAKYFWPKDIKLNKRKKRK